MLSKIILNGLWKLSNIMQVLGFVLELLNKNCLRFLGILIMPVTELHNVQMQIRQDIIKIMLKCLIQDLWSLDKNNLEKFMIYTMIMID